MARINRRSFLQHSAAVGAALALSPARAQGVNEQMSLGIIGTGGRGNELLKAFSKLSDVRIVALCDTDHEHLDKTAAKVPGATKYTDLQKLLDDKSIDAVAIATCNHWHALAAIWACQAGKDVYVEKPLAHNHWEGQQIVRAARKYDRIVQVGTQQRSDPLQAELKDYLHDQKVLGPINHVVVCRFGVRDSIGKRSAPLELPASVDYSLWLGPASDEPIYRDKLHYDWHWMWNTGNGEMGNWGVHVLDDAVNVALRDQVSFPKRILAAGGRVAWNDAGETPNACFAFYDTGTVPLLFTLSNLPAGKDHKDALKYNGVGSGYVVHCEGGYYAGGRGGGAAHDRNGKEIRRFKGDSGAGHQRNFVDAIRSRNRKLLNAEAQIGHRSTAWCNLANVAFRLGGNYDRPAADAIAKSDASWGALVDMMTEHLAKNSIDITKSDIKLSPVLEFDANTELFIGPDADKANALLRREYRPPYAVPAIA